MRADIGLLHKEVGFKWIEPVMNSCGFTLCQFAISKLNKMQIRKHRWSAVKKTIEKKQRRLDLRGIGMARNTASITETNQQWVYGRDPIPTSHQESIRKAGGDKQKPENCQCSQVKNIYCSRESCSCAKSGKPCSIFCLCQGTCTPKTATAAPKKVKSPSQSKSSSKGCKCEKGCKKRCGCSKKNHPCSIFCGFPAKN
jgi:hypothetical protein